MASDYERTEVLEWEALEGTILSGLNLNDANLMDRFSGHQAWWSLRRRNGLDPYSKSTAGKVATFTSADLSTGEKLSGDNFASQDYLNLASHPAVCDAACRAANDFGVHSAGSPALMGNTRLSKMLEAELASFLHYANCTLFPTGWAAGFGVISALVKPSDHIIIDILAHNCLHEGSRHATSNVQTFSHLSTESVDRRLQKVRSKDRDCGILVVTETFFSMDADTPDIQAVQALCRRYNATLLVDVAHDLGCLGPTGRSLLEKQGMLGKVDLVMGSFSKTFASNGGFVVSNHPALQLALRYHSTAHTFSNALSPIQCAVVLESLRIVQSSEGGDRRARLEANSIYLRNQLEVSDFKVLGSPGPIIPIIVGDMALSRLTTRELSRKGIIVNLVEYPAVSKASSRWRVQLMALHEPEQLDRFVSSAVNSGYEAAAILNGRLEGVA